MSPLPDVTVTVQDGALGLVSALSDQTHSVVGFCSKGNPAALYSFSDIKTLVDTLGYGQGVEAAAHSLAVAGGPVLVAPINELRIPLNGSSGFVAGTSGSITQTGSGPALTAPAKSPIVEVGTSLAITLSGTPLTAIDLKVKIILGGARGTATFQYSKDGGATWSATQTTAATFLIPNTGITLNFPSTPDAGDYVIDDTYTAKTSTPFDLYEVQVEILTGGALGTSTFRVALDASNPSGPTWSAALVTPTSGLYTVPGTGLTITFAAGTYVVGTTYTWTTAPPSYNATDITDMVGVLLADSREWGFLHLVGQASSVSGSATIASLLDTLMATAAASYRFSFALLEVPSDTDGNTLSAFASFASTRVACAAGFARITSQISGRSYKRSAAWPIAARTSKVTVGTDIAAVADGALPGVSYLHRDEQVTPGLDAGRFCTLRSIIGRQGFYATNGRLMSPAGSDFRFFQYRRIMDRACKVGRDALLQYLNGKVLTNANGTIFELDAIAIEDDVRAELNAALTGEISAVDCTIDRTNNVATTNTLNADIGVRPDGYAKTITARIGFTNTNLVPN